MQICGRGAVSMDTLRVYRCQRMQMLGWCKQRKSVLWAMSLNICLDRSECITIIIWVVTSHNVVWCKDGQSLFVRLSHLIFILNVSVVLLCEVFSSPVNNLWLKLHPLSFILHKAKHVWRLQSLNDSIPLLCFETWDTQMQDDTLLLRCSNM